MLYMIRHSMPQYGVGLWRCDLLAAGFANEDNTHILQDVTYQVPELRLIPEGETGD
jgi:hypothetical protein